MQSTLRTLVLSLAVYSSTFEVLWFVLPRNITSLGKKQKMVLHIFKAHNPILRLQSWLSYFWGDLSVLILFIYFFSLTLNNSYCCLWGDSNRLTGLLKLSLSNLHRNINAQTPMTPNKRKLLEIHVFFISTLIFYCKKITINFSKVIFVFLFTCKLSL